MRSATLRVIDLGRCGALDYFAASDVPALASDDGPILVRGIIDEENFSIGFNRRWENSLTHVPPGCSRARFTTIGGVMYCRGMGVMRMWVPERDGDPLDVQSVLTNATVIELRARVGRELAIDYEANYARIGGDKFVGGSCNLINGQSVGLVMINTEPMDWDAVRPLFTKKRLRAVRDLSEFGLSASFYDGIIERVAGAGRWRVSASRWTSEETELFEVLRRAHADPRWIGDEARMDLFEFRAYDGEEVEG